MFEDPQHAFIRLPTPEELSARPGGAKPSSYNFGFPSGMGRLLATHERIGRAMQGAFYEIMFAPGALSRAEREMLAAVASAAQDCQY
ncbi:MAG TPA: carboxymuconolactone decarboxylase family protein [Thermoanaerobaculia bacterium]|nr:carboxymuconolactone decarboxylase family protein [Thermoanaerobaculia bacterium]